jgi:hypothetical protein
MVTVSAATDGLHILARLLLVFVLDLVDSRYLPPPASCVPRPLYQPHWPCSAQFLASPLRLATRRTSRQLSRTHPSASASIMQC